MDNAIELQDVSVRFRLPRERITTFKEFSIRWLRGSVVYDELDALHVEARKSPLEPVRDPPVARAEQLHHGRDEHHPHDGRVEEDRRGEADPEQRVGHARGWPTNSAVASLCPLQ